MWDQRVIQPLASAVINEPARLKAIEESGKQQIAVAEAYNRGPRTPESRAAAVAEIARLQGQEQAQIKAMGPLGKTEQAIEVTKAKVGEKVAEVKGWFEQNKTVVLIATVVVGGLVLFYFLRPGLVIVSEAMRRRRY